MSADGKWIRKIKTKWADRCAACSGDVPQGSIAGWIPGGRKVWHLDCMPERHVEPMANQNPRLGDVGHPLA